VFSTKKVGNLKRYMEELIYEAIQITSGVQSINFRDKLRSFVASTLEDL
jgi:hypothetical protein